MLLRKQILTVFKVLLALNVGTRSILHSRIRHGAFKEAAMQLIKINNKPRENCSVSVTEYEVVWQLFRTVQECRSGVEVG